MLVDKHPYVVGVRTQASGGVVWLGCTAATQSLPQYYSTWSEVSIDLQAQTSCEEHLEPGQHAVWRVRGGLPAISIDSRRYYRINWIVEALCVLERNGGFFFPAHGPKCFEMKSRV